MQCGFTQGLRNRDTSSGSPRSIGFRAGGRAGGHRTQSTPIRDVQRFACANAGQRDRKMLDAEPQGAPRWLIGMCQFRLGCLGLRPLQLLALAPPHPTALAVGWVKQSLRTMAEVRAHLQVAGAFLDRLGLDFGQDPVASKPKGLRRRSSDVCPGRTHTSARLRTCAGQSRLRTAVPDYAVRRMREQAREAVVSRSSGPAPRCVGNRLHSNSFSPLPRGL